MKFPASEENVKVTGRTIFKDNIRYLSYSGSSIAFTFFGQKAQIHICSDASDWESSLKGWVAVYINDEDTPSKRFCLTESACTYTLYEASAPAKTTVRLMKYSEAAFGKCGVAYIEIDTAKLLPPPAKKERKIEIIGDSITCGYGVESANELELFDTAKENPAKAYSLLTATRLNADVNLISWSGIGIISNYVPEEENTPLTTWLMPMLYEYTDASCSKDFLHESKSRWEVWDNQKFIPSLILVNLGTNDASYCRDVSQRHDAFRKEYLSFLETIRHKNPNAEILCVLGTMDQRLCPAVQKAVAEFSLDKCDSHIHFLSLPLQEDADGKGADYHPSHRTHIKTAELLSAEIKKIMNW